MNSKRVLENPDLPSSKKQKRTMELRQIYEESVELSQKEKISEKILWNLKLLENFDEIVKEKDILGDVDKLNFNFEAVG
jgi:hypothetical protein